MESVQRCHICLKGANVVGVTPLSSLTRWGGGNEGDTHNTPSPYMLLDRSTGQTEYWGRLRFFALHRIIERRDKLITRGFTKEDEKYISLVNHRGFNLSRRSILFLRQIPQNGVGRRDKLGPRGFTKAIEFFFLFSKSPRNELITTFDNIPLVNMRGRVSNVVISWVLAVLLMGLSFLFSLVNLRETNLSQHSIIVL